MKLVNYKAPGWFLNHPLIKSSITNNTMPRVPKHKFEFSDNKIKQTRSTPTPIERFNLRQLENTPYELFIKRDDLIHSSPHLAGNKLRKLEFLLAEAVTLHNAKHILTAGGLQSNHCRAVAGLAQLLGLRSHLFLRVDSVKRLLGEEKEVPSGNYLLDLLLGANIYLIEKRAQYETSIKHKMSLLKEKLERKCPDEPAYTIPIGGSNTTGLYGYLDQFDEMLEQQNVTQEFDDLIVCVGSGGTMSSLAISNFLQHPESRLGVHAFCACDSRAYFLGHLSEQLRALGINQSNDVRAEDMVNVEDCSRGLGYARSTREELAFLADVFRQTGVLLDPVYTGKALYALVNLLTNKEPTRAYSKNNFKSKLKGKKLLFVHTGGQLGLFDSNKFAPYFEGDDALVLNDTEEGGGKVFDCFGENIDKMSV